MKSKWITYNGKKIFYCDYSNFQGDIQALQIENDAVDAEFCQQPVNSVLSLSDLQNTVGSAEVVELFKKSASRTKPYARKQAVIGVSGIKRILAEAVVRVSGQRMTYFDDIQSAKDWLVAE